MTFSSPDGQRAVWRDRVADLLRDAHGWPLNPAGVSRLEQLLQQVRDAHDRDDADALRSAGVSLAALVSNGLYTRFGSQNDRPPAAGDLPHQRINELIHHLTANDLDLPSASTGDTPDPDPHWTAAPATDGDSR